jgi:hypothetical protein
VREKNRWVWLLALPIGIVGGSICSMVFFVVPLFFIEVEGGDDLIAMFMYGGFLGVGALGAICGAVVGLLVGLVARKRWGGWGTLLAGLVAAVISGISVAYFVHTLAP